MKQAPCVMIGGSLGAGKPTPHGERRIAEEIGSRPAPGGSKMTEHLESFRPGRPIPTHRIAITS